MKQQTCKRLLGFLLLSFILITTCSMASPLFPLHTGVDQNCFLTVGKAMLSGKVPYRDLYEQKGPLLYGLHALAALVDSNGFFGVYLLEILNLTWTLWLFSRMASLFLPDRLEMPAAALSGLVTVTAYCFSRGDNAEEFCLPLVLYGLYAMLRCTEAGSLPAGGVHMLCGIFAGMILWIKFTMLGFYIVWVLFFFVQTIRQRKYRQAIGQCLLFLGGMLLTALPWLVYFAYHHALYDFFYVYFYSNIFLYSRSASWILRIGGVLVQDVFHNFCMTALCLGGVLYFMLAKTSCKQKTTRIAITATYVGLYFFVFVGGVRYRYYLLIVAGYCVFGVIALLRLWSQMPGERCKRMLKLALPVLYGLAIYPASNCRYYFGKPDSYYPQIQFAELIQQNKRQEEVSLLNYCFLDGGFYLESGARLPDTRFFCRLNIPRSQLPQMYAEQDRIVQQGEVEFVVVRYRLREHLWRKEPCAALTERYTLLATASEPHDAYQYELYQLNPET
ncbi:ArnT family glycosyltransferase [Ruminococcus sp.]|uniref:ArnT family glycosyltransferase n=1 Tax=Ruminococcus sp. TaxID=41978 RepID=UPI003F0636FE